MGMNLEEIKWQVLDWIRLS